MAKKQGFGIGQSSSNSIGANHLSVNSLPAKVPGNSIGSGGQKTLWVDKEREIDGIGMGVLSDGTAFLTGRGLARLCNVNNARIVELAKNWDEASTIGMVEGVKEILRSKGLMTKAPCVEVARAGTTFLAYPDSVCLAVLEYYAFDHSPPNDDAKKNYRLLAGKALHDFIYAQVGYDPSELIPDAWRQFHDRMSLIYKACPNGYFGVFKEISDLVIHLGQAGLAIDSSFVPDISVGMCWAKHWEGAKLAKRFGERRKYDHEYPEYFPQAASNPQQSWCYPEDALGEFRRWVREDYIGDGRFARYLDTQVKKKQLPPSFAQLAIAAFADAKAPKRLPPR